MSSFPVHTDTTAPAGSRETLAAVRQAFGFVPNLLGVLAEAPAAAAGYATLSKLFESTSLTPVEQQVVLLTTSFENRCEYCMAAHSGLAQMRRMPSEVLSALRAGQLLPDARLETLRAFTAAIVTRRATLSAGEVDAFLAAGFTRQQVLEVLLGVTQKTLSNYVNHLAGTPLDAAFAPLAWSPPAAR